MKSLKSRMSHPSLPQPYSQIGKNTIAITLLGSANRKIAFIKRQV